MQDVDLAPFVADINDTLRLLKLSGRQLGFIVGTSASIVSNWARGVAAPIASTRWTFARLAMRLRAASPEQLAGWSAELLALDANDGSAFDLVLELAGGARDLRPRSTVAPRAVSLTKKSRRPVWDAGRGVYRGAEGGRRGRLPAPLVVTLRRVAGAR